jgi:hypothetical protein
MCVVLLGGHVLDEQLDTRPAGSHGTSGGTCQLCAAQ